MAYPTQDEMERVLLNALHKSGGQLELRNIYPALTIEFSQILTAKDLNKTNKSGDNTWRNRIRWLREDLILKGELVGVSEGVWGITSNGLARIGKSSKWETPRSFYLIGIKYRSETNPRFFNNLLATMQSKSVVGVGYAWGYDLSSLYQKSEVKIIKELSEKGEKPESFSAIKHFLQLRPGDIIGFKSSTNVNRKRAVEILGYAIVVERAGKVYIHDPNELGQCINVEFFLPLLKKQIHTIGGYSRTIQRVIDPDLIKLFFGNLANPNDADILKSLKQKMRRRHASSSKNTNPSFRKGSRPFVINPKHNLLQEDFKKFLIGKFGVDRVLMEENFVDLKVTLDDKTIFYEVKSYELPEHCIREALGQVLTYSFFDEKAVEREIVVVGPNPPDEEERRLIDFISSILTIKFSYESYSQ